jgi:uncharacterized RDD family membrane protein YckC
MDQEIYPGVFIRVKAIVFDAIVLVIFMALATYLFSLFVNVPNFVRVIAFIFIFLLYDPVFTSTFGGTFGHMIMGIRVRQASDVTRNILIHKALFRSLVKGTLGEISLLTIAFNDKNRAIHDYVADSIVVFVDEPLV